MASKSKRESLPFEPKSSKRSQDKTPDSLAAPSVKSAGTSSKETTARRSKSRINTSTEAQAGNSLGIPEVVSRRMIRRMAVFAGVPTFLGMSSFVVSYILLTRHIVDLPNVAVLLVSLGFFGLGTLGLSYGVLSASWQEETAGSLLGTEEFAVNFRRLMEGLRKPKPGSTAE